MSDKLMTAGESLGLDSDRLADLRGRVQHAIDKGPLPSIQMALARNGELALFETFGAADNNTRFSIYSCTKPLVASAIWLLMGQRTIEIDRTVAHYIPSFGENGKQDVTVKHVLCHTAGFPHANLAAPQWWTREGRLEAMRRWYLDWEPGSRMEYHSLSAHWVLVELIETLTGSDYRSYIQSSIIEPLGLTDLRLGVPAQEQGDIASAVLVGEPPQSDDLKDLLGFSINWPNSADQSLLMFNQPEERALGVPGGGAVATAADVALFYQGLMRNPGELWNPEVLEEAIGRVHVDFPDPITGAPANRGLGVVIAGSGKHLAYRGMGTAVSPRAFGHQGAGGQLAWGDPASVSFHFVY